jgi:hypothetical protein
MEIESFCETLVSVENSKLCHNSEDDILKEGARGYIQLGRGRTAIYVQNRKFIVVGPHTCSKNLLLWDPTLARKIYCCRTPHLLAKFIVVGPHTCSKNLLLWDPTLARKIYCCRTPHLLAKFIVVGPHTCSQNFIRISEFLTFCSRIKNIIIAGLFLQIPTLPLVS